MLLAGIQKKNLDARIREHDGWILDAHFCGAVPGCDQEPHRMLRVSVVQEKYLNLRESSCKAD